MPSPEFLVRRIECLHCYNESGPGGDHGTMTLTDWLYTIDQAANSGTRHVQLIGGEPTLHPNAPEIAEHALDRGMGVEVYSNLVHVSNAWWALLQRPGMALATSYYGTTPDQHNTMTGRPASHRHTRANIIRALNLSIPLRVAIITPEGEGAEEARGDLETLGVQRIGVDTVRPYGRGNPAPEPSCEGLCGACGNGRAAVAPDGTVSPCVFSTWMKIGNVRQQPLATILTGPEMSEAKTTIRTTLGGKKDDDDDGHIIVECQPDQTCSPGGPLSGCAPRT